MKHISFNKYKEYLLSKGFILESGTNIYYNIKIKTYFFKDPNRNYKVLVNIFIDKDNNDTDYLVSVNCGYGSPFIGYESCKIDKRKKFWKNFMVWFVNIENNEFFNCYKVNSFCWHLWNADNDFKIDL